MSEIFKKGGSEYIAAEIKKAIEIAQGKEFVENTKNKYTIANRDIYDL